VTLTAEVLAIGDELIHGAALDTNSKWIAASLERAGAVVRRFTVVGDEPAELAAAIESACARAEVVVATGGLGPTLDDRTREVVAAVLGVEQGFHEPSWQWITEWLQGRGRPVPASNRRQAMLPRGAEALPNAAGTAPGFAVTVGDARLFVVPGVPREMERMMQESVLPAVAAMPGLEPTAQAWLRVLGPSEAALGERLAAYMEPGRNPAVGITASGGLLTVRVVACGHSVAAAEAACEGAVALLRPLLGEWLFAEGAVELSELVLDRLRQREVSLAVAESCTGGLLAARLVEVPGASATFSGGVVAYGNASKTALLGVPEQLLHEHGAVSEPVAAAMAEGVRSRFGAGLGISTTGIAGPGGAVPGKPVGTVCFGLSSADGTRAWTVHIPDLGRVFVRDRAVFECFRALLA